MLASRPRGPLRRGRCRPRARRSRSGGRDRRPDRARTAPASRRRCTRSWGSSRRRGDVASRGASLRGTRPENVARCGDRARPRGPAHLRRADGRGEPAARAGRPPPRERAAARLARVYELFPVVEEFRRRRAGSAVGRSAAAARDRARARRRPDLLLLDEPSLGLAPRIVDVVFEALAGIRERGHHRPARRAARAANGGVRRPHYLIANGEVRLTLSPEDAGDTDRMVAAYLS